MFPPYTCTSHNATELHLTNPIYAAKLMPYSESFTYQSIGSRQLFWWLLVLITFQAQMSRVQWLQLPNLRAQSHMAELFRVNHSYFPNWPVLTLLSSLSEYGYYMYNCDRVKRTRLQPHFTRFVVYLVIFFVPTKHIQIRGFVDSATQRQIFAETAVDEGAL